MWRKSGFREEDLQKYYRLATAYKGKFLRLRDVYLEQEAENEKLSNALAETQNKMLTRVSELKTELAELRLIKERLDSDLKIKLTAEQEAHLRIEGKLKREISQLAAKHQQELDQARSSSHENCQQEIASLTGKLAALEADLKLTRQNLTKSLANYELALEKIKEKESSHGEVKSKLDRCIVLLKYIETNIFNEQPGSSPLREFLVKLDFNWFAFSDNYSEDDLSSIDSEVIKQIQSKRSSQSQLSVQKSSDDSDDELEQSRSIQRILELTDELNAATDTIAKFEGEKNRLIDRYEKRLADLENDLKQAKASRDADEPEANGYLTDEESTLLRGKLELCESENLKLVSKLNALKKEHESALKAAREDSQHEIDALKLEIRELTDRSRAEKKRLGSSTGEDEKTKVEMDKRIREEQEKFIKMLSDKDAYYELVIEELEAKHRKERLQVPIDLNNNSEKDDYASESGAKLASSESEAKLEELGIEVERLNHLLEERDNMIEILRVQMDNSELETNKKIGECEKLIENLRESQSSLLEELERGQNASRTETKSNLSRMVSNSYQSVSFMSDATYLEVTELDYLKRIILGYMTGKDRLTMAKVIAAVLKFSDEEKTKVLNMEKSQSSSWF